MTAEEDRRNTIAKFSGDGNIFDEISEEEAKEGLKEYRERNGIGASTEPETDNK